MPTSGVEYLGYGVGVLGGGGIVSKIVWDWLKNRRNGNGYVTKDMCKVNDGETKRRLDEHGDQIEGLTKTVTDFRVEVTGKVGEIGSDIKNLTRMMDRRGTDGRLE